MEVTKKEILKSMDMKRILQNIFIYLAIYLLISSGFIFVLLFSNPTWGLIMLTISTFIFLLFEGYQIYRVIHLLSGKKRMPVYEIKLDKVNYYLNGKIPVFAGRIKTESGYKVIETNAIYKLKHVEIYENHKAKVLYDEKKNRIYIITLLD